MESATVSGATARPQALQAGTMAEAFQLTAAERAAQPALHLKDTDYECTYAEFAETVRTRAAAFAALGVGRGDTVGFMLVNRPALHLCDTAAMHLGATCFSIYNTSSPEQIEYVVSDAANTIVVTEQAFLANVLAARERVDTLQHVVVIDGEAPEGTMSLDEFEELGSADFDFDAAWRAVEPDDVLCLIYTSGTTGPPKGVQLTHANMLADWNAIEGVSQVSPGGRTISFLPTAHIADRWANLYAAHIYGHTVNCCPNPRDMVVYSMEVKPTVWGGVPRIWEKLKSALEAGFAGEQDEQRKQAITWAMDVGLKRAKAKQEGEVPAELAAEWDKADELVYSKIRAQFGLDQTEWFAVGAAPTPPEVILFFDAIGIEIAELWGMSETTAVATVNPPGRVRVGTVGPPLPTVELKLADDGEILVRGPMIMKGYRNMPEKTAEALSDDGWLSTGDIGQIDEEGYLKIVDRKKELIINSGGKNMSPANIEAKIKAACPLVAQVVAIGDNRPYNVALITLDPDACGAFAAQHGLADASPAAMARETVVREAVEAGVAKGNEALSRIEQIKKFELIEGEWEPGGDELTPTLKLKRKPIGAKYEAVIDALYA